MDWEDVSRPYSLQTEARSLFNNPRFSDVCFLVDGQKVYGHKLVLSMGSPVFERMFNSDLGKENRDVIEIKDLSSFGFMNALRYLYGYEIDYELSMLYDSYRAADKYLLHHFSEAFFEYIKRRLSVKNSCLIYDQLIQIGEREEISLAYLRTLIIENSKETFESEHFTQLDQETLIRLLSLDELSIDEVDLLVAVSKWVDFEVRRRGLPVNGENRLLVFQPIKPYIRFDALAPEKFANCQVITDLLTLEETGSLLLHLLNKNSQLKIELKSQRKAGSTICSVFVSDLHSRLSISYSRQTYLSVNRRVAIHTVYSTYSERATNLSLKIRDSELVELGLKIEGFVNDGKFCFSFNPPLVIEPNHFYVLFFGCDKTTNEQELFSSQHQLIFKDTVVFSLCPLSAYRYHCVRGLEFLEEN